MRVSRISASSLRLASPSFVSIAFSVAAGCAAVAGCSAQPVHADLGVDASMAPDMASSDDDFYGGALALAGCGYSVTTPSDATAPQLGSAMLGPDAAPFAVHLGLAHDPRTSMVVDWRTHDETTLATTVQFGIGNTTDHSTDGVTFRYHNGMGAEVRMHETHLCGLTANTTYSYRVGGKDAGGTESWSPVYQFRTAPDLTAQPAAQITILALGDTRDGVQTWQKLLALGDTMATPDLILFTGDAVLSGGDQGLWDGWFAATGDILTRVPMVLVQGNHEVLSANGDTVFLSQFAMVGDELNYSLDYGPVHLTVLNDSAADPDLAVGGANAQFLDADLLAAAAAPWKLVSHHKPLYSSVTGIPGHGSDAGLLAAWGPINDKHHTDLVVNGHDHSYERTLPMNNMVPVQTPAQGTVYVMAGSAGAPLYDNPGGPWTAKVDKTVNFAIITIRTGQLDLKVYDDMSTLLDSLSITK